MTTETEQQNQIPQYTELGWIPQCENRIGKVDNIRILNDAELDIPPTLVLDGSNILNYEETVNDWANTMVSNGCEIMVRTDIPKQEVGRWLPYIFGKDLSTPEQVDDLAKKLKDKFGNEYILILQAMENNNINRDILSANIKYRHDYNGFNFSIDASPDISTFINRISLPIFTKDFGKGLDFQLGNTELFRKLLLYRIGWNELGNNEYPYIDKVKLEEIDKYNDIISLGLETLGNNPDKYPGPAYWYDIFLKDNNLTEIPTPISLLLEREVTRISKRVRNGYIPFNSGTFKMSFLINSRNEIYPFYIELLEPSNHI